ncbi:DUF2970 domain-containing protein [Tepidicella baoligensis]|uniref:DUF2970 domain-containing protein n=1 Tax=Tepidicella baoligensis TaxID=2707016 RepID=UPI0015DB6786|nr:DUF2970 domain-containing protein [Tepidicella baoligensis]
MKQRPVPGRPSRWWATVKAVLWSFLGLRRRQDFQEDIQQLTPLHVLIVGLVLGFLFVILLMVLVRWVVG